MVKITFKLLEEKEKLNSLTGCKSYVTLLYVCDVHQSNLNVNLSLSEAKR